MLSCGCVLGGADAGNAEVFNDEIVPVESPAGPGLISPSAQAVTSPAEPVLKQQEEPAKVTPAAKPAAVKSPVVKVTASKTPKKTQSAPKTEQQKKIDSLVARVKEKQSARKAMMCDIVIKTSMAGTAQPEVKGNVAMRKKDRFRVHYTEPTVQYLISDGKTMWVYTPDLKQVIKQSAADASLDTNFYIEIENSIEYFVNNSAVKMTEDEAHYTLKMVPKDRKKLNFEEITVKIEKKELTPYSMSMKYDGTLMEVIFSNIRNFTAEQAAAEPGLSDAEFTFKTPEGVQEIDASELMGAEF